MTGCSVGVEEMHPWRDPPIGDLSRSIKAEIHGVTATIFGYSPSSDTASRLARWDAGHDQVEAWKQGKARKPSDDVLRLAHNRSAAAESTDPNVRYAGVDGTARFYNERLLSIAECRSLLAQIRALK